MAARERGASRGSPFFGRPMDGVRCPQSTSDHVSRVIVQLGFDRARISAMSAEVIVTASRDPSFEMRWLFRYRSSSSPVYFFGLACLRR